MHEGGLEDLRSGQIFTIFLCESLNSLNPLVFLSGKSVYSHLHCLPQKNPEVEHEGDLPKCQGLNMSSLLGD